MRQRSRGMYDVTYLTSGTYSYKCIVTDNDGLKATGYTSVMVEAGKKQCLLHQEV